MKIVNKHAPLKPLSKRKEKQLSKPWITNGIRREIQIKNKYYLNGERDKYKYYRNKISKLSRHSKSLYYNTFFETNLHNLKQTWKGINELISAKKKSKSNAINYINKPNSNIKTTNQHEISNILNKHFATIGYNLANKFLNSPLSPYETLI